MSSCRNRRTILTTAVAVTAGTLLAAAPSSAAGAATTSAPGATRTASSLSRPLVKEPVAVGYGGAVSTVDLDATKAGLSMLRAGRQRRRRGGGRGRRPRRHRAVLLRARRRRLLRLLRRTHALASPRSTGARPRPPRSPSARSSTRDRHAVPVRQRGHQRPLRRRAGHARHLADGAAAVRHASRVGTAAAARDPDGRARLRRRPDVRRPGRRRTPPGSRDSPRPARSTCPAAQPPAVGSIFRNPDLAAHLPPARPAGAVVLLHRAARGRDRRPPRSIRRSSRGHPPGRPAC